MKKTEHDNKLPQAFRAMADSTRLKILLMLENQPRTVGEIVQFFNLSQPTITRHLQALATAGLVRRNRDGQHVRYELNAENLKSVCFDLVACFPCCCITVKSHQTDDNAKACSIDSPGENSRSKKTTTRHIRKGGKS